MKASVILLGVTGGSLIVATATASMMLVEVVAGLALAVLLVIALYLTLAAGDFSDAVGQSGPRSGAT